MSRILIVDDEASICWAFRESLVDEGHLVDVAPSAEEGLQIAAGARPDAVVLDVRLPGMDGLTAMKAFRERIGPAPIIIITAFGDLETAVRAMEGGAFDYLVKPFDLDRATAVVKRALEGQEARKPGAGPPATIGPETLVGSSPAMQALFKSIALVAPADVPVLITGESGTGKELVARAIHRHSGRRDGPFLPICLAALNPGAGRGRNLRARERVVHRGHPGPQGAPRTRERRHGPAGRGRRRPALAPGEDAQGHRASRGHAGRGRPPAAHRHPADRRHEPAARRTHGERPVPRGPLLPPQRVPDPHPAAPRATRGHPRAGRAFPPAIQPAERRRYPPRGRGPRRTPVPRLGRERPRAAQHHRARGHRRPGPPDPRGAPPGGLARGLRGDIGHSKYRGGNRPLDQAGSPRRRAPKPSSRRFTSGSSGWSSRRCCGPSSKHATATEPPPPRCSESTGQPCGRRCGNTGWGDHSRFGGNPP